MSAATAPRPARRRRDRIRYRSTLTRVVTTVLLILALAWALAPIYWMVATSFKTEFEATQLNPSLWPHHFTLANYGKLVGHSLPFLSFVGNSLLTASATALVTVAFSIFSGYSLSRGAYRLRGVIGYLILIVRMLPLVVLIAPLYLLLLKASLLDSYAGLIIGYTSFALPFGAWMTKNFMDAVPSEIEGAALVDGCSRVQVLMRVVLPLVLPGILTTAAFVFIDSWNNLIYPLTFINTMSRQTLPAGLLLSFTGQFKTDWGGMMAASFVTTIPLMAAFFAVQRSIVSGLTAGALSGE
ncbi:MAG TPA: carbohydrate ABC transporter permease [Trueperaceae bacterium]|nr:carbohydrate ABC transporter permease [Trueperaceae bacterium]